MNRVNWPFKSAMKARWLLVPRGSDSCRLKAVLINKANDIFVKDFVRKICVKGLKLSLKIKDLEFFSDSVFISFPVKFVKSQNKLILERNFEVFTPDL